MKNPIFGFLLCETISVTTGFWFFSCVFDLNKNNFLNLLNVFLLILSNSFFIWATFLVSRIWFRFYVVELKILTDLGDVAISSFCIFINVTKHQTIYSSCNKAHKVSHFLNIPGISFCPFSPFVCSIVFLLFFLLVFVYSIIFHSFHLSFFSFQDRVSNIKDIFFSNFYLVVQVVYWI